MADSFPMRHLQVISFPLRLGVWSVSGAQITGLPSVLRAVAEFAMVSFAFRSAGWKSSTQAQVSYSPFA